MQAAVVAKLEKLKAQEKAIFGDNGIAEFSRLLLGDESSLGLLQGLVTFALHSEDALAAVRPQEKDDTGEFAALCKASVIMLKKDQRKMLNNMMNVFEAANVLCYEVQFFCFLLDLYFARVAL